MIQASIREVLDGSSPVADMKGSVYVVREGDTVLYVGKADRMCLRDRLHWHLGEGLAGISSLGDLIKANEPDSYQWQVQVLSVEECNELLHAHGDPHTRRKVNTAETYMIKLLRPCLNRTSNVDPMPLPMQYRRQ